MPVIKYKKFTVAILIIVAIVILFAAALTLTFNKTANQTTTNQTNKTQLANQSDPYANLGTAAFALVAQHNVLSSNQQFVSLAKSKYNFVYANVSGFAAVKNVSFIVLVVNDSNATSKNLALDAINSTTLEYAVNNTKGIIISKNNVWAPEQTVFILAGYHNMSMLSAALLSFFVKKQIYAPHQVVGKFVAFNGTKKNFSTAKDPVMDAYLDNTYELGPHDTSLYYPYSYYDMFAYLSYYAPIISSYVPGFQASSSGQGLPMRSMICLPPPPPPDGTSMCVGDYVAMPMFQVGSSPPSTPQSSFDSGDCSFFGINDCIDAEGWAASGINPQLPFRQIPSVYYGFTITGSEIPPSLSGTSGPVASYLPITWWLYGPGNIGESTGGFQESVITQNETQILMNANIDMFSVPVSETPLGNFTVYNSTNTSSTYSCSNSICGINFNYYMYALLSVTSTIPQSVYVISPHNYSQASFSNYTAVLDPVTLSTPKIVKTSAKTYYFSYWSVYSEVDGIQYYEQFKTSNVTFQDIGPTQAQAVYTSTSMPGTVTINSEYLTPSSYITCPPPLSNCSANETNMIPYVNVSLSSAGGASIYSNSTGSKGSTTSPVLQGECYNVNVHKNGYNFIVSPNPVCINGNMQVSAIDTNPFIFNISWPVLYAYGGAPVNKRVPINLTLSYISGARAGDISIDAQSGSGIISGSKATATNGTASFVWNTGPSSGLYYLNFTTSGTFIPKDRFSIPVVVYSRNFSQIFLNISMANSTVHALQGSSFTDNLTIKACRFSFDLEVNATLTCMQIMPQPANLSFSYVNDIPPNSTATFVPNSAQINKTQFDDQSVLHVVLGKKVKGSYLAHISAVMKISNATFNVSTPLYIDTMLNSSIGSGGGGGSGNGTNNSYGALNITVYYNNTPAADASLTTSPLYHKWYTGSGGYYYSGFTIKPWNYEIMAQYDNSSAVTTANVTAGRVTYVSLRINGTVNTTTTTSTTSSTTTSTTTTVYPCNYQFGCVKSGSISSSYCPSNCPLQPTKLQGCTAYYSSYECAQNTASTSTLATTTT